MQGMLKKTYTTRSRISQLIQIKFSNNNLHRCLSNNRKWEDRTWTCQLWLKMTHCLLDRPCSLVRIQRAMLHNNDSRLQSSSNSHRNTNLLPKWIQVNRPSKEAASITLNTKTTMQCKGLHYSQGRTQREQRSSYSSRRLSSSNNNSNSRSHPNSKTTPCIITMSIRRIRQRSQNRQLSAISKEIRSRWPINLVSNHK